jgi:Family of unknown function (DUF7009)
MKLRIDPKRIRFRLSLSELDKLLTTGYIEETIRIDDKGGMSYCVNVDDASDWIRFKVEEATLTLLLPQEKLKVLSLSPSKEGISTHLKLDNREIVVSLQVEAYC